MEKKRILITGMAGFIGYSLAEKLVKEEVYEIIGLDNINAKYTLLNLAGFQVLQDKKNFSVVLPLIWNKVADQKLVTVEP
jgi:UDP-glucuronate 4-epimerase